MGIGTSLGAYFENDFNHQAGIQEPNDDMVKKPADTGDDNVVPPNPQEPNTGLKTDVSMKTASPKVTITDDDIEKGMGIAMSFGAGTMRNVAENYTNYIKMFTDKAKQTLGLGETGPKKVPITGGDDLTQIPFDGPPAFEPHYPEVKEPSPKDAYLKGVQDAHKGFLDDYVKHAQEYQRAISSGATPAEASAAAQKYTTDAYRGVHLYDGGEMNPVYKYAGDHYSTNSPVLADMYSSYLSKHPGLGPVKEGTFGEGATVAPLKIDTSEYHYYNGENKQWNVVNSKAIMEAKDLNKKGVIVDNVWDEPNSTRSLSSPHKVYITFPEGAHTVKSRFAERFDPSSPNMMHGVGAIGIGSAATGYVSQENDGPLGPKNAHRY